MNEIKCPHCGEVFQIDESNYESIARQVRDHVFNEELKRREKEYADKLSSAIELEREKTLSTSTKTISDLTNEINTLKLKLEGKDTEAKLKLNEALSLKEEEISKLKTLSLASKDSFDKQLKDKDEIIAYYKDFKAKQSTKMIGEDLEQHCLYEFNRVRSLFPNAYFDKDNDASLGSKGDFIFKDYDDEHNEVVSIMFEMKNEADETATKHKNEDFIAKLDKDRRDKKCEYAVLVSLLEMDNDTYNEGIVDMSYKYPKMYVIRPQNFITIITLLRNASLKSMDYKRQLIEVQNKDIDLTNFEDNINNFKEAFSKNYESASKKFNDAINEIDKSIDHLNKIKDALLSSDRQLRLANDKAQDITVKKLTKNAPSVAEKMGK